MLVVCFSIMKRSPTTIQRNFRTVCGKDPSSRPTIYFWHQTFVETGCSVWHAKLTGCPQVSDAVVEPHRESFAHSAK